MQRISLLTWMILFVTHTAYAQGDEDVLEKVRDSATQIFLDQASWTLPKSFHNSGLAPSDKERLIEQWANASASCLAESLATYANTTDVPLLAMVSDDGSFTLKGDGSSAEFYLYLSTCMERAWADVGADPNWLGKHQ